MTQTLRHRLDLPVILFGVWFCCFYNQLARTNEKLFIGFGEQK